MTAEDLIFRTAVSDGMPEMLSAFIVAQSKFETGNYKHRFFTEGNNAFGYSFVQPRGSNWQLPSPGPMADNRAPIGKYRSVEDSVHEITEYIKRRQKEGLKPGGKFPSDLHEIVTPDMYVRLLKANGYFGGNEADYAAGVRRYLNEMGDSSNNPAAFAIVAMIAAVVYKYRKNFF